MAQQSRIWSAGMPSHSICASTRRRSGRRAPGSRMQSDGTSRAASGSARLPRRRRHRRSSRDHTLTVDDFDVGVADEADDSARRPPHLRAPSRGTAISTASRFARWTPAGSAPPSAPPPPPPHCRQLRRRRRRRAGASPSAASPSSPRPPPPPLLLSSPAASREAAIKPLPSHHPRERRVLVLVLALLLAPRRRPAAAAAAGSPPSKTPWPPAARRRHRVAVAVAVAGVVAAVAVATGQRGRRRGVPRNVADAVAVGDGARRRRRRGRGCGARRSSRPSARCSGVRRSALLTRGAIFLHLAELGDVPLEVDAAEQERVPRVDGLRDELQALEHPPQLRHTSRFFSNGVSAMPSPSSSVARPRRHSRRGARSPGRAPPFTPRPRRPPRHRQVELLRLRRRRRRRLVHDARREDDDPRRLDEVDAREGGRAHQLLRSPQSVTERSLCLPPVRAPSRRRTRRRAPG